MNLLSTVELLASADFLAPSAVEVPEIQAFIRKEKGKHCVRSHQSNRSFGCYKSKKQAAKRLVQIQYFKHKG